MIQGSWLDTSDSESFTPTIQALIRAHGTGAGFGLLTHSAIFPHFDKRGPEAAVRESAAHPDQLAIGIDEGTALVVRGDRAEVVGFGTVSLYRASRPQPVQRGHPQTWRAIRSRGTAQAVTASLALVLKGAEIRSGASGPIPATADPGGP